MKMSFEEEIIELSKQIENGGQAITTAMINKYKEQLYRYTRINYRQAAFLKLLNDKWEGNLWPKLKNNVELEYSNYFDDGHILRGVTLQGIEIPKEGTEQWELNFEEESEDPLVHVYMKGWDFDYTALTG